METIDTDTLLVRDGPIEPVPQLPVKHGFIRTYYANDDTDVEPPIHTCGLFISGTPVGRHLTFYPSGTIEYVRTYSHNGFLTGLWEEYDNRGRILRRAMYDVDVLPHGAMTTYHYSTEFRTRIDASYWEHGLPVTHYEMKTPYNVELILNMGCDLYMYVKEYIRDHKFGNRTSIVDIAILSHIKAEAEEADIHMWFQSIHPTSLLFTFSTEHAAHPPKKSLAFKTLMQRTRVPMHCGPLYEYICRKAVKEFSRFRGKSTGIAELIDTYNLFIENYIKEI